jgi:hypothetical protein
LEIILYRPLWTLDAMDGVVISDVREVIHHSWCAGFEAATVENIAAVITRAWPRQAG